MANEDLLMVNTNVMRGMTALNASDDAFTEQKKMRHFTETYRINQEQFNKQILNGVLDKRITTTKLDLKAIFEPDGRNEIFDFGLKSEKTATKELEQERKQIEKEKAEQAKQQAEQHQKVDRDFEQRKPTAAEMEIEELSEMLPE